MWLSLALLLPLAAASSEPLALSLEEAVARAEEADERFRLTRLAETSAGLRAHETLGRALPSLSLGTTVTRNAKEIRVGEGSSERVVSPLLQPQGTLVGRATLFRGDVVPEAIAGYLDASAAEATQAEARDALASDVASLYLSLAEAQALVDVYARARETGAELLRLAEARVASETAIALDVEEARAELLRAEAALERARGAAAEVAALLALRAGLEPGTALVARCDGCVAVPGEPSEPLLERRTDLLALERLRTAADIRQVGGWLRFLPTVEVLGNVRLAEPTLFNPEPVFWNAQLVLSWELFSGTADVWSALSRGVESERARVQAGLATREAEVAVQQAEAALLAARAELAAAEARAAASARALELSRARFREGLSSSVEVTEVARRKADADAAAVQARHGIYRAALRLRRALGFGPVEDAG